MFFGELHRGAAQVAGPSVVGRVLEACAVVWVASLLGPGGRVAGPCGRDPRFQAWLRGRARTRRDRLRGSRARIRGARDAATRRSRRSSGRLRGEHRPRVRAKARPRWRPVPGGPIDEEGQAAPAETEHHPPRSRGRKCRCRRRSRAALGHPTPAWRTDRAPSSDTASRTGPAQRESSGPSLRRRAPGCRSRWPSRVSPTARLSL